MSATPWDILGLGEEADAKAIKRAYARALKTTRPDEDAAGFQRLTDAYEWALHLVHQRDREAALHAVETEEATGGVPPELGRPIEELPAESPPGVPEPSTEPDSARGFDFRAFFDDLAPRLSKERPEALRRWLDEHPDLFSIDLKWALIPHVVNALAENVEPIRPRPDNVTVLLAFFGVDARLRRHPSLAPALDYIDASLARMEANLRSTEAQVSAFRSELDITLDAETPDAEIGNLQRQINLTLDGRGKLLTPSQARTLDLAISQRIPRWRVFLSLFPPHRQRDAERHLAPLMERFSRWQGAGIDLPHLELVRQIVASKGVSGPKAMMTLVRIILASCLAALLFLFALPEDLTSAGDGLIAAAVVISGMACAMAATFWLAELAIKLVIAAISRVSSRPST